MIKDLQALVEPQVRIDWRASFLAFCEAHGRPVATHHDEQGRAGRLVFPDGWTHSPTDHKGPAWPPPENPAALLGLLYSYWVKRRGIVREEAFKAQARYDLVSQAQAQSSVPLQQVVTSWDPELKKLVTKRGPLDLEGPRMRLEWCLRDLVYAEEELAALRIRAKAIRGGKEDAVA